MSFLSHVTELQYRLLFLTFTWLSTFCTSYVYKEIATFVLFQYSIHSNVETRHYFITTQLTETFSVYIEASVFIANQLTLVILVYVVLIFLSPGLYKSEINKLKKTLNIFFVLWILLSSIFYKVFIPLSWEFFLNLSPNTTDIIFFEARLIEYSSFFFGTYYVLNIYSIIMLLTFYYINLNGGEALKIRRLRKILFFIIYILAALLTPPDIGSQVLVASLLIITLEAYTIKVIFKNLR